jgi:RHS repeat-associated protein
VGTIQGGAAYSIAPDHLGAPYKIVNSANAQVWVWDHDPFGNGAPTAAAEFWHRLRFPGQVYDSESKLHSNGQRDYDPRLGRYLESDPIGLEGGINTYAYANNNPVNSVDPSGAVAETPWDAFNVGLGVSSLLENLAHGNLGAAALDAAGLTYDTAATAVPFLPGGASTAIALGRGVAKGAADVGRAGKQERLRELASDPKLSSTDRGWIKQEMNSIERGQRSSIRNPPGRDLAHERGREAAKGYDYSHSNLQDRDLHRLQHKYDDFGRANAERPLPREEVP